MRVVREPHGSRPRYVGCSNCLCWNCGYCFGLPCLEHCRRMFPASMLAALVVGVRRYEDELSVPRRLRHVDRSSATVALRECSSQRGRRQRCDSRRGRRSAGGASGCFAWRSMILVAAAVLRRAGGRVAAGQATVIRRRSLSVPMPTGSTRATRSLAGGSFREPLPACRCRASFRPKPAGAVRIFVLGSSAAQGVPDPSFSFGRMLEVMLRERYPGREVRGGQRGDDGDQLARGAGDRPRLRRPSAGPLCRLHGKQRGGRALRAGHRLPAVVAEPAASFGPTSG